MQLRIGHGFDVHAFGPGNYVVIGGVHLPYSHGIVAHSDGDVLVHALCDALLGGAALGDVGQHFPDTSAHLRGADSRGLLRRVKILIEQRGYSIANVDNTVIAQAPKIAPHLLRMRANLSQDLNVALDRVSIKATTTEKLGYIGRGEGVAAYSVALLLKGLP
jgi:2-C-methyl-D-erythritol 2,4-cyclodiphosphate synthase